MWDPDVDPYHSGDTWYFDPVKCVGLAVYAVCIGGLIYLGYSYLWPILQG